eukprot:3941538-Rhodomonas_salina.16
MAWSVTRPSHTLASNPWHMPSIIAMPSRVAIASEPLATVRSRSRVAVGPVCLSIWTDLFASVLQNNDLVLVFNARAKAVLGHSRSVRWLDTFQLTEVTRR